MIERYLLRYFLAVVDQGNFSRAAAHCHVSQPTLSIGIAKLERIAAARLLIRNNQRVELTAAGTRLMNHARRIEREFNLAEQMAAAQTSGAPLRIGILNSIAGDILARAIAMAEITADSVIEFLPGNERELLGRLGNGRVDLALTLLREGTDKHERVIIDEGYGIALSAAHPLADREEIAAEEVAFDAMIVRRHCEALSATSRYFVARGIRPHFTFRSTNDERVMQMVAAGLGLTVMPMSYRWPGMARAKLKDFGQRRKIGFLRGSGVEEKGEWAAKIITAIEQALRDAASKDQGKRSEESP